MGALLIVLALAAAAAGGAGLVVLSWHRRKDRVPRDLVRRTRRNPGLRHRRGAIGAAP